MADPVSAAFITAGVISIGSSIAGGVSANMAAKRESGLLMDQARLAVEESLADAKRTADERRKFVKTQKLAFIKSGVTLAGSPLLVLDESTRVGQEEVDAIVKRGNALSRLYTQRADMTRQQGRASLISGISGGATSGLTLFALGANKDLFSANKPTGGT